MTEVQSTSNDKNMNEQGNKPPTGSKNPYKGLYSYEEKDGELFHGREEDKKKLFDSVNLNFLTLVHGKSGIGKTSLLNAGLFPLLRDKMFLPICIRLNYSGESLGLREQIRKEIKEGIEKANILRKTEEGDSAAHIEQDETLWEYFHRVRHFDSLKGKEVTPVLVLDQFEEIFTLGRNHKEREKLIDELYWFIENQIPTSLTGPQKREIKFTSPRTNHPNARMVISLREDYLPHLTTLIERIPSIDQKKFWVIHLNGNQARDIIGMPGGIGDNQVAKNILNMFDPGDQEAGKKIPEKEWEVEPSILSLICFQVFKQKIFKSFTRRDRDKILMNFYESNLKNFPLEVEEFIESKLLTEDGNRTPFYLEPNHKMRNSIEHLVDRRILRKIYHQEKEYIEVIHDVLAPIIQEKRDERLKEKEQQEREKKLRHKFKNALFSIITAAAIIAIIVAVFAFIQKNRADRQSRIALANSLVLEANLKLKQDNTKALRIAQVAYQLSAPYPSPRLSEVFFTAAYSSYKYPFYSLSIQHDSAVRVIAFSPDATKIFTASSDAVNRLWDLKGNLAATFIYFKFDKKTQKEQKIPITSAVFSRDGTNILTASASEDRIVQLGDGAGAQLWDLAGNLLKEYSHGVEVSFAIFSPDGSKILTASEDNTAKLWDLRGNLLITFIGHRAAVNSAIFSPDGTKIVTASSDGTAKIWDLEGNLLVNLIGHSAPVRSAIFSPDGGRILTASNDGTAILWNRSGNVLETYHHREEVTSSIFSPDGSKILTASWDNTARVQDIKGNVISVMDKHKGDINSAVFSPDGGKILTASSDGNAALWDIENKVDVYFKHQKAVSSAIFSPDGTHILTAAEDFTAKLWPLKGDIVIDISHGEIINSAVFSPDGNKILTVSINGAVKLRDLVDNGMLYFHKQGEFTSAVLSPDGRKILTVSKDGTAKLWDLGRNIKAEYRHFGGVTIAVFSPDGRKILTASKDRTAKLWSLEGNALAEFKEHQNEVISAVFSPEGNKILTASWDHTAKLWNIEGKIIHEFKHNEIVTSAVFSPDGNMILTSSADGTAKLWNLDGKSAAEFKHDEMVNSAVFSPDGAKILTSSNDDTAKMWDLKGNILADLNIHTNNVRFAIFSPDGSRVLTSSDDGTVKLWLTLEAIREWLETAGIAPLSWKERKELGIQD